MTSLALWPITREASDLCCGTPGAGTVKRISTFTLKLPRSSGDSTASEALLLALENAVERGRGRFEPGATASSAEPTYCKARLTLRPTVEF